VLQKTGLGHKDLSGIPRQDGDKLFHQLMHLNSALGYCLCLQETIFDNYQALILLHRNVSSDGAYARKKLRECRGFPDSILYIVHAAIGKNDIDNKSVENCVCVLRNLSYACQEVEDPKYLQKREDQKKSSKGGGCEN
jgi:hypothetical protein